MSYLNYNIFYKAKFLLVSTAENSDMLWDFIKSIRFWQVTKWNKNGSSVLNNSNSTWIRLKNGGRIFSFDENERPVYIESEYFSPQDNEAQHFWACKISEKTSKKRGYCERDWVTEIGFKQLEKGIAEFSCVISYGDMPEFIGRYEETPSPTLPGLIRNLINSKKFKCVVGIDPIQNKPTELHVGDFPAFQELLANPQRTIPYIFISPKVDTDHPSTTTLFVDPQKLATIVCGNARVFYTTSADFMDEMNYMIGGKEYGCSGGSIRVYKPGFNIREPDKAHRHRMLYPSFIEEIGEDETLRIYRRALAQNVNYFDVYFGIKQCQEMRTEEARKKRIDELRSKHEKELGELQNSMLDDAIEEEARRLEAEQKVAELEQQLDEAAAKRYGYEAQIEGMRATVNRVAELETAVQSRLSIPKYPQTHYDIAQYFITSFADRIDFSDSATKSLKTCSISLKELWNVLYGLATVMCDLMQNDSCTDPYKEFKTRTGIDASRGEGSMTRKDSSLMEQFETSYQGRIIDIEPHITFGREGQSIHFGFDETTRRIIIGHCGKHLDIYSTRKRK